MSLSPQQTIAHYRITSKLGEGGMGEVYRATDTKLGRDVAIKVIPEAFAQNADRMARFQREAAVLASLNHPNIAAIYGVEDRALVMELAEGPTLAERIAQGPIPIAEALPIAKQIAEGLEYAHDRGVIHRDLKPANVTIGPSGRVKILDFGLAKALSNDPISGKPESSPTLTLQATMAGFIMGTAAYMAPEQAKGKDVDRRADIWSFGVVLTEMLSGRQMYGGDTVSETLASVIKDQPDFAKLPSDTPAAIRKLLHRCLDKDPQRRLQAIGEARIAIDEALAGGKQEEQPAPARRAIVPWAATALLAAAVLILGFIHLREAASAMPTIHFTVQPPAGGSFVDNPVISPDGSHLAYTVWSSGRFSLYLRDLNSLEARQLAETGDTSQPFWSPDSRFVAFFSDRRLKKISVAGGTPLTLCEISGSPRGGAWNPGGVILFGSVQGIFRIPASGGSATLATTLEPGEIAHGAPEFLADGRHFLYIRQSQTSGQELYVTALEDSGSKPANKGIKLIGASSGAVYSPPVSGKVGHLLYLREASLMAQIFDSDKRELKGDPVPIAEVGPLRDSNMIRSGFSVSSNGMLVYRKNGGGSSEFVWFDRTGKDLGVAAPVDYLSHPAISPDGRRVLWNRPDASGHWDLWITDLERRTNSRLTAGPDLTDFPLWSQDGQFVYFESATAETRRIVRKPFGAVGNVEVLVQSADRKSPASVIGEKYLLYADLDLKTKWDVWVLPLDGDRKPIPLLQTQFNELHPQFSPDGKWFAYASDETGRYEVYVQSFPITGAKWQVSASGGAQPRWRRDGRELFYLSIDGKLMAVDVKSGAAFDAGQAKPLFQTRGPAANNYSFTYDVSADGQRFIVNSRELTDSNSSPIHVVTNWAAGLK